MESIDMSALRHIVQVKLGARGVALKPGCTCHGKHSHEVHFGLDAQAMESIDMKCTVPQCISWTGCKRYSTDHAFCLISCAYGIR
eukprot:1137798-Pelagomonas_calceolata.AAC.3